MTKIAIKCENITSFAGIYHVMDIFSKFGLEKLIEKNFDTQNNDFGWAHLPFSFLAENMVFVLVTAMLKNFYLYLIRHISEKVESLQKTSWVKAFILHFVSVPAELRYLFNPHTSINHFHTGTTGIPLSVPSSSYVISM